MLPVENLQLALVLGVAVAVVLIVLGVLIQWAIIRGAVLSALRQHASESRPRRSASLGFDQHREGDPAES